MTTKKIVISFEQQPIPAVEIKYKLFVGSTPIVFNNSLNYFFVNYKTGGNNAPFQIGIGADLDQTIDNTLAFLQSVWGCTFNSSFGIITISYTRVGNTIEVLISNTLNVAITVWELGTTEEYIQFFTATPCQTAYLSNLTSPQATFVFARTPGIYNLFVQNTNQNLLLNLPSDFDCEFTRGFGYSLQQGGSTLNAFSFYQSVTEANVFFSYVEETLAIFISGVSEQNPLFSTPITYLYSIDGTNYQSNSSFTSVEAGTYTVYIKDSLGCIKTFEVVLSEQPLLTVEPYTFISESNSLRFIKRVTHGNCGNYKNVFNTLSCEENVDIANKYTQLFQTCDTLIKTQVKTSYQNVEVAAGNTEIDAEKIVANIGLTDKRDCFYFNNSSGALCVYFESGNIYEYDTTDVIGTYQLNGMLPEYGVVGNVVLTDFGYFTITNIQVLDSGYRALVLNTNFLVSSLNENGTIQCLYNRDTFDIWEFTIDMANFANQIFNVGVRFYQTVPDVNFPDVFYISEKIHVKERWPRTLEVIWRNTENTDVYYFSGIEMKNRLMFADINTYVSDGEVENQKTDSQVISIDAKNYNQCEFEVQALTTGMVRKIVLALKHNFLVIENVPYKLAENPTVERQGKSNFYRLAATLIEAGDVFTQGSANTQVVFGTTELVGLLQGDTDSEYIQIN